MRDQMNAVAAELTDRAHALRVEAVPLAPRAKNAARLRAAKLDRAARLLREEAGQ